MAEIHCRNFSGYKPCGLSESCDRNTCEHYDEVRHHIVIIHLGALGAVLRSTALLPAIHRTYRKATVTWITQAPADQLLQNNPLIDRVYTVSYENQLQWQALESDAVFCIDKSLIAAGIAQTLKTKELRGFKTLGPTGAILPANPEARDLWHLGLSNKKKFFENTKTENQLTHEALKLGEYKRDEYVYQFTGLENEIIRTRRELWAPNKEYLIGLNTGCSGVIPYKKLTVEYQRSLINQIAKKYGRTARVVLLGGSEDEKRNREISAGMDVISSSVLRGLRDGLMSIAACDMVISGDSLGLHMAIALKKWCIAWFGPTCAQEIDLYDRGVKIKTRAACSPCWKRVCDRQPMCYDLVDSQVVLVGIEKGMNRRSEWVNSSSSKQRSPEIFS